MTLARMRCKLFTSAFSGELVFQVTTSEGEWYEGVAPKRYVEPKVATKEGVEGTIRVFVIGRTGDGDCCVRLPDEDNIYVREDFVDMYKETVPIRL